MNKDIERILFSEEQIKEKVADLGRRISLDYGGRELLLVSVLKGSVVFMADLMRAVDIEVSVDFLAASSYGMGSETSGTVSVSKDISLDVRGKEVLIVEDILDSGVTLGYIVKMISEKSPSSIRVCALLDKPDRRKFPISPDYSGFVAPDEFLVGYGLDYAERYRNLPYIGILSRRVYEK